MVAKQRKTPTTTVDPVKDDIDKSELEKKNTTPKRQCSSVIILYRLLYRLQQRLRDIAPRISRSRDRVLASIAYPARFIGHIAESAKLLKLSSVIGDYRTLTRVVGTPATIENALTLLLQNSKPDRLDRVGDYIQAVSDVIYQVLEDLAYLSDKGIIKISAQRTADLWVWSSMAWGIETFIVLLRAPYYYFVLKKEVDLRSVFVNAAWLPLCYHWSTYKGVLGNDVIGVLGTLACWPSLAYQWTRPL